MPTEQQVKESLEPILVPGAMRSLVKLNLVREITITDGKVDINLASTGLSERAQDWLKAKVNDSVGKLPEVKETAITFTEAEPKQLNDIKYVVAVMSGKGGVGKSLVTGLLAVYLARQGYEVGVLDADITGPSIPRILGVTGRPMGTQTGILPVLSRTGIEVMSINLLLQKEDEAVIWRGPLITNTIQQFWNDVLWGKLDYLLIDLPPGTADATLTVMKTLPLSGVVIVFSPQELAAMIVRKVVNMAQQLDIRILGMVENMSYFLVPETGKRIEIFGASKEKQMVKAAQSPLLAKIPIDPQLAKLCDEGSLEWYDSEVLNSFGEAFLKTVRAMVK